MSDSDGSKTGRYWLLAAGIFVTLLVLAAIFIAVDHISVELSNYGNAHEQNTRQIETEAHEAISQTCIFAPPEAIKECISKEQQSARNKHTDQDDLYAQQQMAVWAFGVGVAGFISVFMSLAGIAFVWRSLNLNREAVAAAVNSNNIAREIGEAQVRAYLSIKGAVAEFRGPKVRPRVRLFVKNTGQSPALSVKLVFGAEKAATGQDSSTIKTADLRRWNLSTQIGGASEDHFEVDIPAINGWPETEAVLPDGCSFRLDGFLEYQTMFSKIRGQVDRAGYFTLLFAALPEIVAASKAGNKFDVPLRLYSQVVPPWLSAYLADAAFKDYKKDQKAAQVMQNGT